MQWEIYFLTLYPSIEKLRYFFLEWKYVLSSFKPAFGINFWLWEVKICVFAYFQFDNFLKSKIDSESSFEMKRSIFLFFKKKLGAFRWKEKKLENWFPIVFFKMDSSDVRGYFHIRGLRIGTMIIMNVLKSPRRVRSVVCEITHLYPQATFGPDWGGVLTRSDWMIHSGLVHYSFNHATGGCRHFHILQAHLNRKQCKTTSKWKFACL